jgi:NAD(P)-dependent dehydrogenase (short-subunit alcohol dehydrogenase family)
VLVTGASRGLGLALAHRLAAAGAAVAMVARDGAALERAATAVREHGVPVLALAADVADRTRTPALVAEVAATLGPPSIVIHNASSLGTVPLPLLADTTPEVFDHTFAVNVLAPFWLSRAVVGAMVLAGRGLLVHISSDAAVEAYPRWGAYGASKAALDHLARIWDAELAGTGVAAIAIDPGEMDTAMHADAIPDADRSNLAAPADVAARIAARVVQTLLHGRNGDVRTSASAQEVAAGRPARHRTRAAIASACS